MITDRNLAEEYAQLWHIEPQKPTESGAQFRERIACRLSEAGHKLYAHEALFNDVMTHDPFAYGSLDRGYGEDFIADVARQTDATLAAAQRRRTPSHRLQILQRFFG